ncbi:MAG TPA: hypothetical protein VKY31_03955 [Terriglobia bacterium]|nr:hypothetical protein [Terriglobia bacterium]
MKTKLLSAKSVAAGLVVLSAMLLTLDSATATSTLVFPQLVNGPDISITTLANPSTSATVTGTLSFFNQNGTPRVIQIDGQGAVSSISGITIPPQGTVSFSTTPVGSQDVSGMARFDSDNRAGGVVRFVFGANQVGVLSADPQSFGTLLLNTSGGNDTGVAIANPTSAPIFIHLAYVNASGQTVEQVDPAELNPLAPNAQVAEFVSQFGFRQVANQNSGSIQISAKNAGQFSGLGLLVNNGTLASTALLRGGGPGASANFAPTFTGNYSGTWTNTTFGSTGTITLGASASTATGSAVINLTMTGNVFGGSGGSASLAGNVNLGVFTATGTSALFGPATMTVNPNGTFTFTANSVPSGTVATFKMTGTATATGITGNYSVTFVSGGPPASGTITMAQSSITMK